MDPLSDMLGGLRASGSSADQVRLEPSRSIRFDDGAALTLLTLVEGAGAVAAVDGAEFELGPGSTALVRGPGAFDLVGGGAVAFGSYRGAGSRQERLLRPCRARWCSTRRSRRCSGSSPCGTRWTADLARVGRPCWTESWTGDSSAR
ncbi:hypothetical protein GCM10029992_42480 [Glycomyces albus]